MGFSFPSYFDRSGAQVSAIEWLGIMREELESPSRYTTRIDSIVVVTLWRGAQYAPEAKKPVYKVVVINEKHDEVLEMQSFETREEALSFHEQTVKKYRRLHFDFMCTKTKNRSLRKANRISPPRVRG